MSRITESHIEATELVWLEGLGYAVARGPDIDPDGAAAERNAHADIVLRKCPERVVKRLKPTIPSETRQFPPGFLLATEGSSSIRANIAVNQGQKCRASWQRLGDDHPGKSPVGV